jgi:hypothetical protein
MTLSVMKTMTGADNLRIRFVDESAVVSTESTRLSTISNVAPRILRSLSSSLSSEGIACRGAVSSYYRLAMSITSSSLIEPIRTGGAPTLDHPVPSCMAATARSISDWALYGVADTAASCWIGRHACLMGGEGGTGTVHVRVGRCAYGMGGRRLLGVGHCDRWMGRSLGGLGLDIVPI